jgi:glutathione S-transferase
MSHNYKLTYFNYYGRGEAVRMLFALAGVEYEDRRIEVTGDDWKEFKPKTPFGQLPLLEIDGRVFCQSVAITRYLANKFGFAGKTELDKLQADMIVDCIMDLATPIEPIFDEEDETKKNELRKNYEGKLDKHLENLNKMLIANNDGNGFFVGDSMTWADLVWTTHSCFIYYMKYGLLVDKYPKLTAIRGRVEADLRLAEWISKRPKAEF